MPQSFSENIHNYSTLTPERVEALEEFQQILEVHFNRIELLNKALTHKSYANEKLDYMPDNERFEFLGDAVLDLIIRDYSLRKYLASTEGELSKLRSVIAGETNLVKIARRINIGKYLLLGKGEELTGGRSKDSLLANGLEAVAAAVYLDQGFEKCYESLLPLLQDEIDRIMFQRRSTDYKSHLQELTQFKLACIPTYRVLAENGPEHEKTFEVQLTLKGEVYGDGIGRTKKEAEQEAARVALERLQQEDRISSEHDETISSPPSPPPEDSPSILEIQE